MEYTILGALGNVIGTVSCHESEIDNNVQLNSGTSYVVGAVSGFGGYLQDGELISLPQKPSPHHTFNYINKQWEDPRTLQDHKVAQWTAIKQARSTAEYTGFTWDSSTFDSDAISQNRITGAVALAQMSSTFSIGWVLADNTVRTLNQSDMLQVGTALGAHVAEIFAKGVLRRAAIDAAVSAEEVEAVVW